MKIKITDIKPFTLEQHALRQTQAYTEDGKLQWRLDLVLSKPRKPRITSTRFSLRYFDSDSRFIGLDTPYHDLSLQDPSTTEFDITLLLDPPTETKTVELRISTSTSWSKIISEDPRWYLPLFIIFFTALITLAFLFK